MAKILVVEDEVPIANTYKIILARGGHKVEVAHNVTEALAAYAKTKPDLILLDMIMPEMSGLDFLRQLGAPKGLGKTKVIALSNIDSSDVVADATKLGVAGYLVKVDFTPRQVLDIVSEQLAKKSS